jgi:hypothetical protein
MQVQKQIAQHVVSYFLFRARSHVSTSYTPSCFGDGSCHAGGTPHLSAQLNVAERMGSYAASLPTAALQIVLSRSLKQLLQREQWCQAEQQGAKKRQAAHSEQHVGIAL